VEKVGLETTVFGFRPSETGIMISDEVVHKIAIFGPEEVSGVVSVKDFFVL
jgi:uncharacterized alkaline shock family protein YloU